MTEEIRGIDILGTRISAVQIPGVIALMEEWIARRDWHNNIVISNVDTIIQSRYNSKVSEAVNNGSLAVPDGFPLMVLARLSGFGLKHRVYGPDLLLEFLRQTEGKAYSHFFYGTTEETLARLVGNIRRRFPASRIAGTYAPPFRDLTPEESAKVVEMINSASPSVLWVGLGCPKQELWMHRYKPELRVPVMVGVGAAFDFFAGTKPQAPEWMRNNGFEWLFRLLCEPRRLWRRYLINNFLFLYLLLVDFMVKIFFRDDN